MHTFGRKMLEMGVLLLVLIASVTSATLRRCPSGYIPGNKLGISGGGSKINMIGTEQNTIKDIHNKKIHANKTISNAFTSTEGTITSTTTKAPVSVIIFAANNHYGRSAVLTFTKRECQNLPELIQNRVNSINTRGQCVILCDNLDCGGWCIKFAPGTPAHHRFRKLRFHNRAESAISCE